MSTWVIISWIGVAILTAINVVVFLKLKQASEQMLKMAFPGAKNMNEALANMQQMMGGLQRGGRGPNPFGGAGPGQGLGKMPAGGKNMDAQLKAAMDMLQQIQKNNRR